MDAYAFIRFERNESVERAIEEEHGKVWLGQAIKCEHARPAALSIMLSGVSTTMSAGSEYFRKSPTMQPLPMMTVYYPGYLPVVNESSSSSSISSNWFRAHAQVQKNKATSAMADELGQLSVV